jgi:hypothetical protein
MRNYLRLRKLEFACNCPIDADLAGLLRGFRVINQLQSPDKILRVNEFQNIRKRKKAGNAEDPKIQDKKSKNKRKRSAVPEPMRSGSSSPVSILARMLLEHLRNASSTHSPVLALASRNISPFSWANLTKTSNNEKPRFGVIS